MLSLPRPGPPGAGRLGPPGGDCPTDRRGTVAALTDEGFAKLAAAAPGHVAAVREHLVDRLRPAQLAELGRIAAAVRDHLAGTAPPPG